MIYGGREIDVVGLWGKYIDIPPNIGSPLPIYLPKVVCPNPAHQTTKRHFQVNTKKALVHCFARCGISGSYERAIAILEGLYTDKGVPDERAARRLILRQSRVALGRAVDESTMRGERKTVDADAAVEHDRKRFIGGQFQFLPRTARAFLDLRGVDASARGKWQIGFDEDADRIIIPAFDERGVFRFLISRALDRAGAGKYLYTEGTQRTSILFGACYIEREALQSRGLVLCEGPFDAINLHSKGATTAVAILGSGLSRKQVRLIDKMSPKNVYLFFDCDAQGVEYIFEAYAKIKKIPLYVCRYPAEKEDPAELTREEVKYALDNALPIAQFVTKARNAGLTRKVERQYA